MAGMTINPSWILKSWILFGPLSLSGWICSMQLDEAAVGFPKKQNRYIYPGAEGRSASETLKGTWQNSLNQLQWPSRVALTHMGPHWNLGVRASAISEGPAMSWWLVWGVPCPCIETAGISTSKNPCDPIKGIKLLQPYTHLSIHTFSHSVKCNCCTSGAIWYSVSCSRKLRHAAQPGAGIWTNDLPITSLPALPDELQPPLAANREKQWEQRSHLPWCPIKIQMIHRKLQGVVQVAHRDKMTH